MLHVNTALNIKNGLDKSIKIKRITRCWQLYVILFLPLLYVIIFDYIPMAGIQIGFKKFDPNLGIWGSPWIGFDKFQKFFSSYYFERLITNTLRLSFYMLIVSFPMPVLFALILNTVPHLRFKKMVQTVTYMPHFISTVVLVGMILQIFNPRIGLYGIFYSLLNNGAQAKDLLASPGVFPHMYVWSGIFQNVGWTSIIYIAALSTVSSELHESAQMDGASRLQRVIHIDFPSILPTATIMLILQVGHMMNIGFEKAYLMQNNLNLRTSEIISTYVYKVGLDSGALFIGGVNDYSYATAINLFNSVINLIMIVLINKLAKKMSETSLW